jgi:hypothetical protein
MWACCGSSKDDACWVELYAWVDIALRKRERERERERGRERGRGREVRRKWYVILYD